MMGHRRQRLGAQRRGHDDVLRLRLKRDEIWINHPRALAHCQSVIFSENRFTVFRIML